MRTVAILWMLLLSLPSLARDIYVSPSGSDTTGTGAIDKPLQTLFRVQGVLAAGDTVWLRQGAYTGGMRIRQPNVTIQSYPGEKAYITLPYADPLANVVWFFKSGCTLSGLDISGGSYYAVKFETYAVSGRVLNCHIHDSGADGIKVVPLCHDVTVQGCEIDHTGHTNTNCQGIDAVNANHLVVSDCYIHDIQNVGVSVKGGAQYGVIRHCLIVRCQIGVQAGQTTDRASMWAEGYPGDNPGGYESRDQLVEDCTIVDTTDCGISCWAALRPVIVHNVMVDVTTSSGAGLLMREMTHYPPTGLPFSTPCQDVTLSGNVVRLRASSTRFAVYVQPKGLTPGTYHAQGNVYYQPGTDVLFVDSNDPMHAYKGPLAGWASRMGETGSMVLSAAVQALQ